LRFAEQKNEGRKNKRWSLRRLEFIPKTSTKNVTQEFHLYIFSLYGEAECFVCNYFMHPNKLKLILSLVQGGVRVLGGEATHFIKQTPIVMELLSAN
jgi:hypothetical protein